MSDELSNDFAFTRGVESLQNIPQLFGFALGFLARSILAFDAIDCECRGSAGGDLAK